MCQYVCLFVKFLSLILSVCQSRAMRDHNKVPRTSPLGKLSRAEQLGCLSRHLAPLFMCLYVCLSVFCVSGAVQWLCLSQPLSVSTGTEVLFHSVFLSICVSFFLYVCLSFCVYVCFICLWSVCLSRVCPSVGLEQWADGVCPSSPSPALSSPGFPGHRLLQDIE